MSNITQTQTAGAGQNSALLAAFAEIKKADAPCIFASSPGEMCEAERRRLRAISNGQHDAAANLLLESFSDIQPVRIHTPENQNCCEGDKSRFEIFADGSLYFQTSADSEVWAFASDFYCDRISNNEDVDRETREFFGEEVEA